jgi:F-box protein 9
MDPDVDKHYKQKYFPSNGVIVNPPPPPSEEIRSGYSTEEYRPDTSNPSIGLAASLSSLSLSIEPEDPEIPCFLEILPDELLLSIILHLGLSSLSSLTRLSRVCKKFLLLTQTENMLYKTLCIHYFSVFSTPAQILSRAPDYNNEYRRMLIERPRLRFDGVYIATCHYLRPGVSDFSWNTPMHMVTYFRFVRFFEDGEVITVLTTAEPGDVVGAISREGKAGLKGVSDGVWRMSETGGVVVEVRGPRRYMFVKELQVSFLWRG